jgi:hypothetical protein
MSQEIINVLNYLGEQLGIVIDWSSENVWPQVMDILGRYRLLEIISTCMWIFVEIVFVVISLIAIIKCIKASARIRKTKEDNFWWYRGYSTTWMSGAGTTITILSVILGSSSLFALPMNIGKLLKWIIVPEIKYLEMLKGLMA